MRFNIKIMCIHCLEFTTTEELGSKIWLTNTSVLAC